MPDEETNQDISISVADFVATIEIRRPPYNFFDSDLIRQIADVLEALDENPECRSVVLASQGKAFCAGANFGDGSTITPDGDVAGQGIGAPRAMSISRQSGCSVRKSRSSARSMARRWAAGSAWPWCPTSG